jgi:site-specific recombinase XerD
VILGLTDKTSPVKLNSRFKKDYNIACDFLLSYQKNQATFNAFRREVERFSQWCWHFASLTFKQAKYQDIENYLLFCQKPPNHWIGIKNVRRFIMKNGQLEANPEWRPFVASVSKAEHGLGKKPIRSRYSLSEKGCKEIFTVLNCFYKFLVQEDHVPVNPVARIKQKNRFYRSRQSKSKVRRISDLQWQYVMEVAEKLANEKPNTHERTLFIMSALYLMYLRVSELSASARWTPQMKHFSQDNEGNWWFTTVGKNNKERDVAVSTAMLTALKRWRKHLGTMTVFPIASDSTPLIPKVRGQGAVNATRQIRRIVQTCFDAAHDAMLADNFTEEADSLKLATVHWLRHTGISEDVKTRPREHVRDDAGHSSSAITDRYIDIDLNERHQSAVNKALVK